MQPIMTEFAPAAEYILMDPEPLQRGTVYLLHLDRPLTDGRPARHYVGWSKYLPARALAHLQGRGARFTQVACERGIGFLIARIWPGDRTLERKIKNRKEGPRLCPICSKAIDPRQQVMALEEDLL